MGTHSTPIPSHSTLFNPFHGDSTAFHAIPRPFHASLSGRCRYERLRCLENAFVHADERLAVLPSLTPQRVRVYVAGFVQSGVGSTKPNEGAGCGLQEVSGAPRGTAGAAGARMLLRASEALRREACRSPQRNMDLCGDSDGSAVLVGNSALTLLDSA